MDTFRRALARLFDRLDETESEEHQKNIVAGFLNDAFYQDQFEINTRERIDLVIHRGPASSDPAGVIIEAKKVRAGEMIEPLKNNVKALHELILYYFEERERHQNIAISQLVITDVYNWFIFDENDFRHFFYDNTKLRKLYQIKQQQKKDNTFFYSETARILRDLDDEIPVTYLNLRETADALNRPAHEGNRILIPAYKLFSPEHLLKLPFANDANTLNRSFYNELLHILGLYETTDGGLKKIQRLPDGERHDGSLLENTINLLRVDNALTNLDAPDQYGATETEQLFGVGLELCITWLNRILFLKLLEGQLVRYHDGDKSVQFLTARHIREFDDLSELFFEVLAVPEHLRPAGIVNRFGPVPYLNSSLFELTPLERKALKIKDLKDRLELPLFGHTALKDQHGKRQTGQLPALQYLLTFLDAYDFSSDGPAEVQPDNKPLINAAVLGLIFEKLNGYRDGSFFTPGFVTMYMVRDAIRRAVLTRFNESFAGELAVESIDELNNYLSRFHKPDDLLRFNAVINSLRIVDPAVGSGHFLVSALNELIALKAELGLLADREGRRLRHYDISIVNDELVITDEDGQPFQYLVGGGKGQGGKSLSSPSSSFPSPSTEVQRVQELIFHEKQMLIENCLFGVDINPNSINICRLRLWIELLKSAYYVETALADRQPFASPARQQNPNQTSPANETRKIADAQETRRVAGPPVRSLQTLPNLDINLKTGNSLVGRFGVGFRVDTLRNQNMREKFLPAFQRYSVDVMAYKHCRDRAEKDRIRTRIAQFREFINQIALVDQKEYAEIKQLEAKLAQSALTFDFFNQDDRLQNQTDLLETKKAAFREKQRVFDRAFEWRFEFPEVLDETGNFTGFDVVVGNPPYIRQEELGDYKAQFSRAFPNTYAGTADLYVMFIEQGLTLLRPNGQFAYILPNKWMRAGYGANLRKWLKTKAIEQITDFGDLPVFDEATTYPSILAIRNAPATDTLRAATVETLKFGKPGLFGYLRDRTFEVPMASLQDGGWVLSDATVQNLLAKLKNTGVPLKLYVDDKIYRGVLTGLNEAFVISGQTRAQLIEADPRSAEVIKPFLAGRDIKRYQTPVAGKFLILFERGITAIERGELEPEDWLAQTYPAVYAWLKPHEAKAKARADKGMYWWELRACDYYPEFEKPKLMLPDIAAKNQVLFDDSGAMCANTGYIIPVDDKFLLGILNSNVVLYFYASISSTIRGGYLRFIRQYLEQIPIPDIPAGAQAPIIEKVDAILAAKRTDSTADTTALEADIDALVFDLFGLTNEERAVVLGGK